MSHNWMKTLTEHYQKNRRRYPNDKLMILFDIDGAILDMRYMIWRQLKLYDQTCGTNLFKNLLLSDITVHENNITPLLTRLKIKSTHFHKIISWFDAHAWSSEAILEAHRPYRGVLEVIRWFQMQPNTAVGLNTARPEIIRADTLSSLNKLGQEYKIHFSNDLLFMKPNDWPGSAPEAKMVGVHYFQQQGYRVFAFVDNEPDNLQAIAHMDLNHDILLLHADTIFQSHRTKLPPRAIGGNNYDITALIPEPSLPNHIQFVWKGLYTQARQNRFLASDVHWAELDLNQQILALSTTHTFNQALNASEITMYDTLEKLFEAKRGVKLNFNLTQSDIDLVIDMIKTYGFSQENLWFSGRMGSMYQRSAHWFGRQTDQSPEINFRQLAQAFPNAIIDCPIDFMAPLIFSIPSKAQELLSRWQEWGITRYSLSSHIPKLSQIMNQLEAWGFEINIYNVSDLETFLRAALLMPQSITSSFDFPQWHKYEDKPITRQTFQRQTTVGAAVVS